MLTFTTNQGFTLSLYVKRLSKFFSKVVLSKLLPQKLHFQNFFLKKYISKNVTKRLLSKHKKFLLFQEGNFEALYFISYFLSSESELFKHKRKKTFVILVHIKKQSFIK